MNKLIYCLALFLLLSACTPKNAKPEPPATVPKADMQKSPKPTESQKTIENPPQAPVEERPVLSADKDLLYINSSVEAGTLTLYTSTPNKGRTPLNGEELKRQGYRLHIYTPFGLFTQDKGSTLFVSSSGGDDLPSPDAKITITLRNYQGDIFQTLSIPVRDSLITYQ
ncbi:hypothetical protein [Entomospira culicis]|uniref:Lipoprotein n=1 Tax=Entomospira culicis TaxID=2719989 RepID=A0A968GGB2_9SPIO|nr:hypothetical protein [Entomospira culicis]NIZ19770.1 hypothetical protein [Entomospira culicis]NIZ69984.1 hypothetical protein [Entomospira culicis]WDI37089.1 hypothetical protein PVA46_07150 [Entomospira culicis]WDI38718.1 hypothetical protein PVA47_07160 [Entomospira culicis]